MIHVVRMIQRRRGRPVRALALPVVAASLAGLLAGLALLLAR